jgi:hypothetical protein
MRSLKPLMTLSSIALAGFLYVSGTGNAVASPEQMQAVHAGAPTSHDLHHASYYRYQGKHYKYKYNGKYYNYRVRKHGKWHYY